MTIITLANNFYKNNLLKAILLHINQPYNVKNLYTGKYALLAGHSKWANIRHIKAAKDGEKSSLFSKMSRQIRLAVQEGGSPDISLNSQLKSVVEEALRKNMPMGSIQNSIQKCKQNKTLLKRTKIDLRYKQKVFLICVVYTDNFAAVKMEMASILRKAGASFLDANNLFEEIGLIQGVINKSRLQTGSDLEDTVTEDGINFDAEEVEIIDKDNGVVNFICRPLHLWVLRKKLETNGYVIDSTDHIYVPKNIVELLPEDAVEYEKFIRKLKELPAVEEIYDNINVT